MKRILITGAAGHVGKAILRQPELEAYEVFACDINPIENLPPNASYYKLDIRNLQLVHKAFRTCKPDIVINLASIVTPTKEMGREFAYDVDVNGTENIIKASIKQKAQKLIIASSGAAYGYHPENVSPLREDDPIRGNYEFPYSHHKRLVEEFLSETRNDYPQLEQFVFRVGTVLGDGLENQITALFHKPTLLGLSGYESPFVFAWDTDVAKILLKAAGDGKPGIYNVAGDGVVGITQIARILKKPVLRLPAWVFKSILAIASPLGLSRYGPEQVRFLQYRPVLDNTKLKEEFGYTPEKSSVDAFEAWRQQAGL